MIKKVKLIVYKVKYGAQFSQHKLRQTSLAKTLSKNCLSKRLKLIREERIRFKFQILNVVSE